jgi:NAD(P)-dependent dehydrogenase (short-subunit alcohol dehydrogenase family)
MKMLHEITIEKRSFPLDIFTYPCVDPNTDFLKGKNIFIYENSRNILGDELEKKCKDKGAVICNALTEDSDILIINSPLLIDTKLPQTEKTYYDILFHYIKPAQEAIRFMQKKSWGQIVFVLPPFALIPSVEYTGMASFAAAGLAKGLALRYAPMGIVTNGLVLGRQTDYDAIAEWVVFLASGNARYIVGGLIDLLG